MALRVSPSLKKVNYNDLCQIFNEDYTIGQSLHDDPQPFVVKKDDDDDSDLKLLQEQREAKEKELEAKQLAESGRMTGPNESEGDIESDDLMLHIDEALSKIVAGLSPTKIKASLNKQMLPHMVSILNETTQKNVLVIQPQGFVHFLVDQM